MTRVKSEYHSCFLASHITTYHITTKKQDKVEAEIVDDQYVIISHIYNPISVYNSLCVQLTHLDCTQSLEFYKR